MKKMLIERKTNAYKATLGMHVCHERTMDWNAMTIVHHIEMSVPGYNFTSNGPELIDIGDLELANDEE